MAQNYDYFFRLQILMISDLINYCLFLRKIRKICSLKRSLIYFLIKFHAPKRTYLTLMTGNYIYTHQHLFQNILSLVIIRTGTPQRKFIFF